MQSFLDAVAQRAADAGLAPPPASVTAVDFEALDANCLLIMSRMFGTRRPAGSRDWRNIMLGRYAQVSRQLWTLLRPLLEQDYRRHRQRKNSLTRLAERLGAHGSWNHQLQRVRLGAHAVNEAQCQGGCGQAFNMSRMYQLLDDNVADESRDVKLVCRACTRRRCGLPPGRGQLFATRVEMTDDYGEGGEPAARLRFELCKSGYGLGGSAADHSRRSILGRAAPYPALCDADGPVLCDLLVSGLGRRCQWIDVSGSAFGDAGLTALARGLPACKSLLHLNLNSTRVGDQGVVSLATVLTPARPTAAPTAGKELKWLYLAALDDLGNAGAIALAAALTCRAMPKLECLWCCGAFSADEPLPSSSEDDDDDDGGGGESRPGFRALTRACEARPGPLVLELEHGFAWGM